MNWKWNFDNEDNHESHSVGFHGTKARRKLSENNKADNLSDYDVYYDNFGNKHENKKKPVWSYDYGNRYNNGFSQKNNDKWDTHSKTAWSWDSGYNNNYWNRNNEHVSKIKKPDYYVLPDDTELKKYAEDRNIQLFKDLLYVCYYTNLTNKSYADIYITKDEKSENWYDIAKEISKRNIPLLDSAAVLLRCIQDHNTDTDDARFNQKLDNYIKRVNDSNNNDIAEWIGDSNVDLNKRFLNKGGIIDKMCLFEDFGNKFKVISEDMTKFVQNSEKKKNTLIQNFNQINRVRAFEFLLPTFDYKLLHRALNVSLPSQTDVAKQKIFMLLDYSGSMGTEYKQQWVSAIILNRLKHVFENNCELYFSYYVGHLYDIQTAIDEKSGREFWSNFNTAPNGSTTYIHGVIEQVLDEYESNSSKYTSLNGTLPEILVLCDGEDNLSGEPVLKTNIVSILNYNSQMHEYSIKSGGSYVHIDLDQIRIYNKMDNPEIINI
jgi:hypothetical protein